MDAHAGERGARLRVKGRRPLLAAMVIDSVGTGMFLPFTVLYFVHTAGLTAPAVGVALTVAGFVVLPAPLAVAPGIDRFPARIVVAAGNLISCAAFATYLFVHSQLAVTAAAVVAGAGQATFWTATRALISEVARPGERRSWFALQTAIRYAGYGLGGLAGAAVVSFHSPAGFEALAAIDAVSYLGAALLLICWRQPPPAAKPAKPPAPDADRCTYWSALTDRPLAGISAINTAFVLCAQVLPVVLSVYVVATLHLAAWIAGMLCTLNTLLIATGQAPVTLATRRIPHRHALRGAAATWAVAFGPVGGSHTPARRPGRRAGRRDHYLHPGRDPAGPGDQRPRRRTRPRTQPRTAPVDLPAVLERGPDHRARRPPRAAQRRPPLAMGNNHRPMPHHPLQHQSPHPRTDHHPKP